MAVGWREGYGGKMVGCVAGNWLVIEMICIHESVPLALSHCILILKQYL